MIRCPACDAAIAPEHELTPWCACGDLDADHGDQGCALCACPDFVWDGREACPACLEVLDEWPGATKPAGARDAA